MASMRVVVIGGGIAGCTAATLLAEAGAKVTLLEASPSLGGLAKSNRTTQDSQIGTSTENSVISTNHLGFPTEHSLRVYHEVYSCYFNLLKRIPFNEKESLFQELTPISLALIYQDDYYIYRPNKNKYFFTSIVEKFKLMKFLRRQGFTTNDFLHLLKEDIYNRQCEERLLERLSPLAAGEYLKNVSPAFWKIIFANYTMSFAGTKDTSALLAAQMDTEGLPFTFFAMANGPTSEIIFDSWENYLEKLGVEIKKESKVTEFISNNDGINNNNSISNNDGISAVKLASGEVISGDVFICAVSDVEFPRLIQSAITQNQNTHFKDLTFTGMWSHGVQFYLRDLPKTTGKMDEMFQPGILCAHLHTPWKIVSVVQGKDFWKNVKFPDQCGYCLSVTLTDAKNPGALYQKPFVECTQEEIRNELLHQIRFTAHDLVIDWHLDDAIVFMDDAEYQATKESLDSHQAYQRKDGQWILNFSPLYTPTPKDFKNEPATRTHIKNLYLAGSFCRTAMFIPTMEKACESGFLAAQAISEDFKLPVKITLPFKSYDSKLHPLLRNLDAWLYKFQRWLKSKFSS